MTSVDFLRDHLPDALRPAGSVTYRALRRIFLSDRRFIELHSAMTLGQIPDLARPRTFNEKVNWRKLYDRSPLHQLAADRVAVRDYVAARVGSDYLVPILGVFWKPEDIPWAELPAPYIIKATHGSGWNIFVADSADVNPSDLARTLRRWLRMNYYYHEREWGYKHIPRRLIIERFIGPGREEAPEDFKFFCFDGVPRLVQVDKGRFTQHTENFYDLPWAALPFEIGFPKHPTTAAPSALHEMVRVASELSRDFDFVRVDLYCVENQVFFGELTIYPAGGFMVFVPPEWDEWLGALWKLPNAG